MNHSTELTPPKESTQWVEAGALRLKAPLAELLKYWEKERLITPLDRHLDRKSVV